MVLFCVVIYDRKKICLITFGETKINIALLKDFLTGLIDLQRISP